MVILTPQEHLMPVLVDSHHLVKPGEEDVPVEGLECVVEIALEVRGWERHRE